MGKTFLGGGGKGANKTMSPTYFGKNVIILLL
jgi:hypothetical protein